MMNRIQGVSHWLGSSSGLAASIVFGVAFGVAAAAGIPDGRPGHGGNGAAYDVPALDREAGPSETGLIFRDFSEILREFQRSATPLTSAGKAQAHCRSHATEMRAQNLTCT
jgi:hypothetical protein